MARPPRIDAPETLHHVFNRGLSKRTLVETARDARQFLASLSQAARQEKLVVLAYSLLTTHYHLFVQSPHGLISDAIRDLQSRYALYFNRVRTRKGPLFESRFHSRIVETPEHARILLRYIDANAVDAGLAQRPIDHPHSSAYWYARTHRPHWLDATRLAEVLDVEKALTPQEYATSIAAEVGTLECWVVERGFHSGRRDVHPVDELFARARPTARRRFLTQTLLADGTTAGTALIDPTSLEGILASLGAERGPLPGVAYRRPGGWPALRILALRRLAGCTWVEVVARVGRSRNHCQETVRAFERWLEAPTYREALQALTYRVEEFLRARTAWPPIESTSA